MDMDTQGMKHISGVLKDVKEIYMVKSDADMREQEARIKNLQKQAEKDEVKDTGYHGVVLLPVVADMPAPPEDDNDG
jgi:predicted xylose isomerase-like sugar epimerase